MKSPYVNGNDKFIYVEIVGILKEVAQRKQSHHQKVLFQQLLMIMRNYMKQQRIGGRAPKKLKTFERSDTEKIMTNWVYQFRDSKDPISLNGSLENIIEKYRNNSAEKST